MFSEALSLQDYLASVIGGGVMSMEDWCNYGDRRRPKSRSTRRKPCDIAASSTTNATQNAAVTGLWPARHSYSYMEPSSLPPTACYQSSPLTAVILQSWFTDLSLGHLVYRYSFTDLSRPPSFFHRSISCPSQRLFYRYSFTDPSRPPSFFHGFISCPSQRLFYRYSFTDLSLSPSFFHGSISCPSQRQFYRYSFTDTSRPPSFFLRSLSCSSQQRFYRYSFTHRSRPRSHIRLVQHFTLNDPSRSSAMVICQYSSIQRLHLLSTIIAQVPPPVPVFVPAVYQIRLLINGTFFYVYYEMYGQP